MRGQNCIDVKHVINLSVPYLTRFFGSAGTIRKVEKNEVSRHVTIQYHQRTSVDRAMRFNGRVLDKNPIKVRRVQGRAPPEDCLHSVIDITPARSALVNRIKSEVRKGGSATEQLWEQIVSGLPHLEEEEFIRLSLFLWGLSSKLVDATNHFRACHRNSQSSYQMIEIQRQLVEKYRERRVGKDGEVWFEVYFPNVEEEQCKVEAESIMQQCFAAVSAISPPLTHTLRQLRAASLIHNPYQHDLTLFNSPPTPTCCLPWEGTVANIGIRDICFQILPYQQPNTALAIPHQASHPVFFSCSLRLLACKGHHLPQACWCDYYKAQIVRHGSGQKCRFIIQKLEQIDRIILGEDNIFFQQGQYTEEQVSIQIINYQRLQKKDFDVYYVRGQHQEMMQVYEDEDMRIEQEVEVEKEQSKEGSQVVMSVGLIEVRQNSSATLNQIKLTHYLSCYIEQNIIGKGLIIASRDMANKLAENIIEREKEAQLFGFAHPTHQLHIAEELWRLYSSQNERKIKHIVAGYRAQAP